MNMLNTSNRIALLIALSTMSLMSPAALAVQSSTGAPSAEVSTNLKVLPKGLTTKQVRDIMETWSDETGTECSTCHVRNVATATPDGKAHYDYANDSKQEKRTARVMYEMTEQINTQFISKVPNSGIPITCGNCHRGHLSPEPYSSDAGK